ncbi:MAG: hypothetical protein WD873_02035, partial [Candidatus Hydrogenedentales bacterium]
AMQLIGFALVVAGTAVLAGEGKAKNRLGGAALGLGILAAALFGVSHVAAKYIYLIHPFGSGLVWRGLGGAAAALFLFLIPVNRRRIIAELTDKEVKTEGLFLLGQAFGGAGFLLINYALSLGSATLVNALSGVQYAFLFLATIALSRLAPKIVQEPFSKHEIVMKGLGILGVMVGLATIFFA